MEMKSRDITLLIALLRFNIVPTQGRPRGATREFCPGPQPERGPLNTCLKDRYTLIEQSDLETLIEQSQYS